MGYAKRTNTVDREVYSFHVTFTSSKQMLEKINNFASLMNVSSASALRLLVHYSLYYFSDDDLISYMKPFLMPHKHNPFICNLSYTDCASVISRIDNLCNICGCTHNAFMRLLVHLALTRLSSEV